MTQFPQPGLCLTFDDNYIYQWHSITPTLKHYNAKATFFISGFHRLNEHQRITLKDIQRYGHEIGYHTLNHPKASEFLNGSSVNDYITREIVPGLDLMKKCNFIPTAFCYPYSDRNEALDQALLNYFKILRWGSADSSLWFHPPVNNQVVCGGNVDLAANSSRSLTQIKAELQQAHRDKSVVVYYAHRIGSRGLPYTDLEEICQTATSLNLRFYSLTEISQEGSLALTQRSQSSNNMILF